MQTLAAEEGQVRYDGIQELARVFLGRLPYFNRMALRHLDNVADAEDAVQDAFLSAYRHLNQFKTARANVDVAGQNCRQFRADEITSSPMPVTDFVRPGRNRPRVSCDGGETIRSVTGLRRNMSKGGTSGTAGRADDTAFTYFAESFSTARCPRFKCSRNSTSSGSAERDDQGTSFKG